MTAIPVTATALGATSEVGTLRTVMLHRPGPELSRLTPRNNDQLLFDGVPWVARAQEEHDEFAEALRSRGVEVLYVARLLAEGVDRIAKKIGEEATEVVIAAKNEDRQELAHEVADLWFHTYVLLAQQGLTPEDIWAELRSRRR
jgi:phosphoribosyl-ATP pyrophosphohydrolase